MKAEMARTFFLVVLSLALACGGDEGATPEEPTLEPETPPIVEPETHAAPAPIVARVGRITGEDGPALIRTGQDLEAGANLTTGASEVVVDFREGGRVTAGHGSRLRVGGEARSQALLGQGTALGTLAPQGNSPRAPLRIGLPAGSVEIEGSGNVFVAALPDGNAWVAVLSGACQVSAGATDEAGHLVRRSLHTGQALVLGPAEVEPTAAPGRLEQVQAMAAQLIGGMEARSAVEARAALGVAATAYDRAAAHLDTEVARGAQLAERHRREARGSDAATALQRALVDHSRALLRLRAIALVRFELLEALSMSQDAEPEPIEERRAPLRVLLGLDEAPEATTPGVGQPSATVP